MQLQENIKFADRYLLIRLLGRGGFSEVWLAQDTWTHLQIAIKVYAPGQGMDTDGIVEFAGELAKSFDLNHTNLLHPTHMDSWQDMPYLIMPYCSQGSCARRVGKMEEKDVWKLLSDVASGLMYLHSKDVVHQDIKPDNILLDAEGNYMITDFGISARARNTLRKSVIGGAVSGGTTAYMAPERFSKQPAPTKASDIWSLGAMLFELIEGTVPFGEIGGGLQKSGADIPDINSPVSDRLKEIIYKMLSAEPWDRPTAETLVEWAKHKEDTPEKVPVAQAKEIEEKTVPMGGIQTPITPVSKKKKKKIGLIIALSIGVPLLLAILTMGGLYGYQCHQERLAVMNIHQQHMKQFDAALNKADIDHLEELQTAYNSLRKIQNDEANKFFRGEPVYEQKKEALQQKLDNLSRVLHQRYNNVPTEGLRQLIRKKLNKVEYIQAQVRAMVAYTKIRNGGVDQVTLLYEICAQEGLLDKNKDSLNDFAGLLRDGRTRKQVFKNLSIYAPESLGEGMDYAKFDSLITMGLLEYDLAAMVKSTETPNLSRLYSSCVKNNLITRPDVVTEEAFVITLRNKNKRESIYNTLYYYAPSVIDGMDYAKFDSLISVGLLRYYVQGLL